MIDQLSLVATADPFNRKSWSGTPAALAQALQEQGITVRGVAPMRHRRYDATLATATSVARHGRAARGFRDYYGGRSRRHARAMAKDEREHPGATYLHTDTFWLPTSQSTSPKFLYRDTPFSAFAEAFDVSHSLRDKILRRLEQIPREVQHVFATSSWARRGLVDEGFASDQVSVVGTGTNLEGHFIPDKLPATAASGRTLVIAKVRQRHKGLDLLLEAHQRARLQRDDLTLDVVAPKGFVAAGPGVRVHHNITFDELIRLYCDAALYAMPARYEPYGLVYLEALACGTPVLGAARCALPEFTLDNTAGFAIENLEVQAIAAALLAAHAAPERLVQMGNVGRQRVAKEYSWGRTVQSILERINRE